MGLGNGNYKQGNKSSNHAYELRSLELLGGVITGITSLTSAVSTSKDFELNFVRDTGNSDVVIREITVYDQGTGVYTTSYEDASGAPYVPVGPLEYLDPSAVLNLLLTELQTIVTSLDPELLSSNGLDDLSDVNITYGTGKRAFSIYLSAGTAVIGGLNVTAPFSVDFAESGIKNTCAGITIDTTGDPAAVCIGAYTG